MKNLSCNNLSLALNDQAILKKLDLVIPAGKICGILGANGAGKTSLMKTIVGIYTDYSGSLEAEQKECAWVPLSLTLPFDYTAYEVIKFAQFERKRRDNIPESDKINQALEILQITDLAGKHFQSLSSGEQKKSTNRLRRRQRVSLAHSG